MKFVLVNLLLGLVFLTACSQQTASSMLPSASQTAATPSASNIATVPSQTAIFAPSVTPQSTLLATETPALSMSPTATPVPQIVGGSSPNPQCDAAFSPVGFTPDGKSLIGLFQKMDVPGIALQQLDIQTMTAVTLLSTDAYTNAAALSMDGQNFAWALPDFSIQLINLPDRKISATLTGHTGSIYALLFSPDGSRLYSTSADGSIIVWDVIRQVKQAAYQPAFLDNNFPGEVQGLGISPDGKTLVTIPTYGSPRAWDTATLKQVAEYPGEMVAGYTGSHAAYSPDGKYLAIGFASGPGDTTLWQVAGNTQRWHGGMMAQFAFSPDSRLFAHTEPDENNRNQMIIRSLEEQTVVQIIPALSDAAIRQILFSPDSRSLVWLDGTVLRFWDIARKRLLQSYAPPCP